MLPPWSLTCAKATWLPILHPPHEPNKLRPYMDLSHDAVTKYWEQSFDGLGWFGVYLSLYLYLYIYIYIYSSSYFYSYHYCYVYKIRSLPETEVSCDKQNLSLRAENGFAIAYLNYIAGISGSSNSNVWSWTWRWRWQWWRWVRWKRWW